MEKLTLRLKPRQYQVLCELRDALGCNISLIVRAIVGDFLTRNEDILERIISDYESTGKPLINFIKEDDTWDY